MNIALTKTMHRQVAEERQDRPVSEPVNLNPENQFNSLANEFLALLTQLGDLAMDRG